MNSNKKKKRKDTRYAVHTAGHRGITRKGAGVVVAKGHHEATRKRTARICAIDPLTAQGLRDVGTDDAEAIAGSAWENMATPWWPIDRLLITDTYPSSLTNPRAAADGACRSAEGTTIASP